MTATDQNRDTYKTSSYVGIELIQENLILAKHLRGSVGRPSKEFGTPLLAPGLKDRVDENSSTFIRGFGR